MTDGLINLDRKVFLALNHFSAPGIDPIMLFLSGPVPWILFLAGFLFLLGQRDWAKHKVRFFTSLGFLVLTYILTDQTSVHLFKEVFMRLRPCHEPTLLGEGRLVANRCGGQFGFVSSHAANSFGLAVFSVLLFRKNWLTITLLAWAALISYSRIYLGVHYPGDILGGMVLGAIAGGLVFKLIPLKT